MSGDDFKDALAWAFGLFVSVLVSLVAWLGKRSVRRLDEQHADHEQRIREIEKLAGDIMKRPDVLALYADQKEEFREKFKELRQDHKELRNETASKLDYIINRLDNRAKNERVDDAAKD